MTLTDDIQLPPKGARVAVAMSGGVDSSVAAAVLKAKGCDVVGISLRLHGHAAATPGKYGSCCSAVDLADARLVAERMDFPFYVADMQKEFQGAVIDDFVSEYAAGRTPNPCVRCNEKVKFRHLMEWALDLGADCLATGHYATVRSTPTGPALCKAADPAKDQSYFLFSIRREDLARTLFPLGGLPKERVRALARELGLANADKPDSQEICFVPDGRYAAFVERMAPDGTLIPGKITDASGSELGSHEGLHRFTIGQRKGLGVPSLDPLYVLSMDSQTRTVVVGPESSLYRDRCTISGTTWLASPEEIGPGTAARIRYRAADCPARVEPLPDGRAEVFFSTPQRAITPGQALVVYAGDRVLGGGWIEGGGT